MFCSKCGSEIMEEAVICPKCGCYTSNANVSKINKSVKSTQTSSLKTAAKILMIISCVCMGFWFFTLAWTIPMTINYNNKIKTGESIGTGFKICTLLFVNVIAGILMLCDNN